MDDLKIKDKFVMMELIRTIIIRERDEKCRE
jgi:hypothetical protein